MRGVNKVILVGNLGKDPEVQALESGVTVARFPIATTESYKDKTGQRVEQTEWHNIVLWRGLAEVAEKYLKKGGGVYLEGKIRTRSWDDKEGNKRYTTEIVGDNMVMLDRKPVDAAFSAPSTVESTAKESTATQSPTDLSSSNTESTPF